MNFSSTRAKRPLNSHHQLDIHRPEPNPKMTRVPKRIAKTMVKTAIIGHLTVFHIRLTFCISLTLFSFLGILTFLDDNESFGKVTVYVSDNSGIPEFQVSILRYDHFPNGRASSSTMRARNLSSRALYSKAPDSNQVYQKRRKGDC